MLHLIWLLVNYVRASNIKKKRGTANAPHLQLEVLRKPRKKDTDITGPRHTREPMLLHLVLLEISQVSSYKTEAHCFIFIPSKEATHPVIYTTSQSGDKSIGFGPLGHSHSMTARQRYKKNPNRQTIQKVFLMMRSR